MPVINQELLDLLRCPVCVKEKKGELEFYQDSWLICTNCDRKYPVWEEIPIMLLDEGDKWQATRKEELPIPPPKPN
ncbi:MAG: Trm112 family protein [Chloroflexi bacterium]|nr:Trm112 family protein [Chloroflexota bacterium]